MKAKTKKYNVRVTLACDYNIEVKAKDYKTAEARAEKIAEREFENGNTEYAIVSEASEI